MNREKVARELVLVARDLVGGYQDEMAKLKSKYENHPDFRERPNSATMELRKAIMKKVGGKLDSSWGYVIRFRLGSGYKNSTVTKILNGVVNQIKRHGMKPPSDPYDLLRWRDADGNELLSIGA